MHLIELCPLMRFDVTRIVLCLFDDFEWYVGFGVPHLGTSTTQ